MIHLNKFNLINASEMEDLEFQKQLFQTTFNSGEHYNNKRS